MPMAIVQWLLGIDMVDLVTRDRMGDEHAKGDCDYMLATSLPVGIKQSV